MKIAVLGGSVSKFGELWDISPRALAREVTREALENSGLTIKDIDGILIGNMLSGILGGQENLGAFFAEEFQTQIPSLHVEAACASGGMALHTAVTMIESGRYKRILVLGIEKMTDHKQHEVDNALMAAGSDEERQAGVSFSGLYALMARAYLSTYNATEEQLAHVAIKNHYHGSLNPKAQFRYTVTLEQVMQSNKIADPLKLFDCSPISDGAAAVVLSEDKSVRKTIQPVYITASTMASDTLSLHKRKSLISLQAAVTAAEKAYYEAGIAAKDINVAEVHDCFSIAEVIAMEDLGFSKRGEGARDIESKKFTLGKGKIIVNSSGGLKACGHPVGATGIKQIVEVAKQLRGDAEKRQVKHAKTGLAHNVAGSGATAIIHVLQV